MSTKIIIPESWSEVTLRKFQEVAQVDIENERLRAIEIISIMADCDPDLLKNTDLQSLNLVLDKLEWTKIPPSDEYKTEITIKGIVYNLVNLRSLSNGEWIDLDGFCEKHIDNIHKIMAVLYRPVGEEYNSKSSEERASLFLDEVKISDVFGTMLFFSLIGIKYMTHIETYLQEDLNQRRK
jgi:hypothetical protein